MFTVISFGILVPQRAAKQAAVGRVRGIERMRWRGTMRNGKQFPNTTAALVWEMGSPCDTVVAGDEFRMDAYGSCMLRSHYGHPTSQYAWEIDHILPVKYGGPDDLWNLQPLQRENNRSKAGKFTVQWQRVLLRRLAALRRLR